MLNNNIFYIDNMQEVKRDEKLNRDEKVIELGNKIRNYYIEKLKENKNRIFAKYNLSLKLSDEKLSEKKHYEASAFSCNFHKYFKSKYKVRFKKDVVSCFAVVLKDCYGSNYLSYFYIDKKEYELRNDEYLNEVFNYFKTEIDFKINENKGFYD